MSEATTKPEEKKTPKIRVSLKYKLALAAVKERRDLKEYHVDYKSIAQRYGCSHNTLRKYWWFHLQGQIDWGEPESQTEIEINSAEQLERTLKTAQKFHSVLLNEFEAAVLLCEDFPNRKKKDPTLLSDLTKSAEGSMKRLQAVLQFRAFAEKGFSNLLEEMIERRRQMERRIAGTDKTVPVEATVIVSMSDEARGLAALKGEPPGTNGQS
jgi:transposase-like protein